MTRQMPSLDAGFAPCSTPHCLIAAALEFGSPSGTASDMLGAGFDDRTAALFPFKLSHGLRFIAGDRAGMFSQSEKPRAIGQIKARQRAFSLAATPSRLRNMVRMTMTKSQAARPPT